jgi:hypothetical protein
LCYMLFTTLYVNMLAFRRCTLHMPASFDVIKK